MIMLFRYCYENHSTSNVYNPTVFPSFSLPVHLPPVQELGFYSYPLREMRLLDCSLRWFCLLCEKLLLFCLVGEMNDTMEKTASSLAIVEKKPQRTGGCVGIFFQLFDWNRRFAKKKLFSKKLLPPVRLKQASKKFGGDEKRPKLRLIADENNGGFPNMKKNCGTINVNVERKHEMRAPGLVARLMGLESMPALQREKSKKVKVSGGGSHKAEKFVDNVCGYVRGELSVEKGGTKQELRPQKLQKTSFCERLPMTTFRAETLPFKNVLSRSRKHHPKLPSPVKNPRNLSKKNASKLIGAATRILEPGLQTGGSKCALTYSNTLHRPPIHKSVLDKTAVSLSNQLENPVTFANVASKGHPSCQNCGHLPDNLDSKPSVSEQPLVFAPSLFHCVGCFCQGSERSKLGQRIFYKKSDDELEDYPATVARSMGYERSCVKLKSEKNPFSGQVCEPRMDVLLPFGSNCQTQSQNQISRVRDSIPARSKLSSLPSDKVSTANAINETKNFVSLNQNLGGLTRSRVPAIVDNGKFETERRIGNRQNDSVLSGRKRRPTNLSRQGESSGVMSSTFNKQTCSFLNAISGKEMVCNAHLTNRQSSRSGSIDLQERRVGSGKVGNNVVSFPFNSPVKQKTGIPAVAKRRVQNDSICDGVSQKVGFNENHLRTRFERPFPFSGDALGALLEQKLKELTCQGEDIGGNAPKKTTAMILQELIAALTSEMPFQQDKSVAISNRKTSSQSHLSSTSSTSFQSKAMKVKLSLDQPLDREHLSPGSVLEAYSSDASCPSSNLDDCFEHLDSATSINTPKSSKQLVANISNNVSEILRCLNLANCGLKGAKLDHATEVLLNAELVFGNAALAGLVVQRGFSINHLIVEELETLATVLWMNFGSALGVEHSKEANQLRRFALDSIIEYLYLRFDPFPNSRLKLSKTLPLCINTNMLIFEIVEEARKWEESSRYVFDELIEREISHSLREWTQFENETFETGMEISRQVLQILVEEIVMDL